MSAKYHAQGMKWIRHTTRLAVYLRDGLRCVWCRRWGPRGLSLDHYVPRAAGGSNAPSNLLTACTRCNRERQHARFDGARVRRFRRRSLPRAKARQLLREHGTLARAMRRAL